MPVAFQKVSAVPVERAVPVVTYLRQARQR